MDKEKLLTSDFAVHLTDILANIITERPNNALELLEALGRLDKTGKLAEPAGLHLDTAGDIGPLPSKMAVPLADMLSVEWGKRYCELVVPPKPPKTIPKDEEEEGGAEEEEEADDKGELADISGQQECFRQLGVGIPEVEAFRVSVSAKRLLDKEPLKTVRFFGKIFCLSGSYWVVEAEADPDREAEGEEAPPEEEEEEEARDKGPASLLRALAGKAGRKRLAETARTVPPEPPSAPGPNKYEYWVTTDLVSWRKLPNVKPIHIQAARSVKKLFTGDLDAPVSCHPPFPGLEKEYLRAQLARISHGCKVAPRGTYEDLPEEDEEEAEEGAPPKHPFKRPPYETLPELTPVAMDELPEEDDEQWSKEAFSLWGRGYPLDALLEPRNWVHEEAALLQTQGRTTEHKFEPEEGDDEEEEGQNEGAEEGRDQQLGCGELVPPMITQASRDDTLHFEAHHTPECPAWATRVSAPPPSERAVRYYLLRSLRWPGAFAFAAVRKGVPGAEYGNTYIGYGMKHDGAAPYAPAVPVVVHDPPSSGAELPTDYTYDDELEFSPPPPPPEIPPAGEEEEEEENED